MDIRKSVSIVILNYNNRQLLQEHLPYTYEAIKNSGIVSEIIIVDDFSTDGSVEFIRSAHPEVILIANTENKGFSDACNSGIAATRHELILLLGADVKLAPDYFEHQWKYFLAWDTFGVMGCVKDMETEHIQQAACIPKFEGLKLKTDYSYFTNSKGSRLFTLYLPGVNALVDAAKIKELGGFYDIFDSFYCQDMELSIRAWRLKWKSYYENKAVCRRAAPVASNNREAETLLKHVHYRNLCYLHVIHLDGLALAAWCAQVAITDLLPRLLTGQTWIVKSYLDIYRKRETIKAYKIQIKNLLDENESRVSIFKVVIKITNSVKSKKMVRLKP